MEAMTTTTLLADEPRVGGVCDEEVEFGCTELDLPVRGTRAAARQKAVHIGRPAGLGSTRVSVVIPTLNEALNLPHIMPRIPVWVDEVVIVDGRSTDDTIATARYLCPSARVATQDGRGKGDALACGFDATSGEIIVMLDADGSTDPAEIPQFLAPLLDGADFAKGSRRLDGGGSADLSVLRAAGNRALTAVANLLYRRQYTDLCYGYNAFWARCLDVMHVDCDGFEVETLIHVRAARAGLDVREVPSMEHERLHGESKLHAFRDGWRVLRTLIVGRFARRPDRETGPWQSPILQELATEPGIEI